ncbi:MAG: fused MFS/spermidine synthase [Spirochaetales bacterium]|nr:fused MFS/spermidine synthase [Spirochaetales bacterium]
MKKKTSIKPVSIIIPCITVFIASACIMILEIVAGRLVAKYLGATLYVWTSVISVVLGGITIGNYIGGRVADKYPAKKTLAFLFGLSSVTCVIIIILNNATGEWTLLWQFPWPLRVFTHVAIIFLLPSSLLGTISPVVAKIALDAGHPKGMTIGKIYAWSAGGSILGTLAAGFFLISLFGTTTIIWMIAAILLAAGILYWFKSWILNAWAGIFVLLAVFGMVDTGWTTGIGVSAGLRKKPDKQIIYEDESDYCYIAVKQLSKNPDIRQFRQDDLESHSKIIMDNITDLQFAYTQIFAAVTHLVKPEKEPLSVLSIGGGGYVFPRYIQVQYPGSFVDVAEIDPRVTEAATRAFGLSRETSINTINTDARQYINQLLEQGKSGKAIKKYDFIYGDAFGESYVPFQLLTDEFHKELSKLLAPDGLYAINLLDVYTSGRLLGAVINTLERTFTHIYIVSTYKPAFTGWNFVVVAGNKGISIEEIRNDRRLKNTNVWILNKEEIDRVKKAGAIILTDNHAPVEQLISPLSFIRSKIAYTKKILDNGDRLQSEKKWKQAVAEYKEAIEFCPEVSFIAYSEICKVYAEIQDWDGVLMTGKKALEYNERAEVKVGDSLIKYSVGLLLIQQGYEDEGIDYMQKAIEGFKENITRNNISPGLYSNLGKAYAYTGDFENAVLSFKQELNLNRTDTETRMNLVAALITLEQDDEAKKVLSEGIRILEDAGFPEDAEQLKKFLENFEEKKKEYL